MIDEARLIKLLEKTVNSALKSLVEPSIRSLQDRIDFQQRSIDTLQRESARLHDLMHATEDVVTVHEFRCKKCRRVMEATFEGPESDVLAYRCSGCGKTIHVAAKRTEDTKDCSLFRIW